MESVNVHSSSLRRQLQLTPDFRHPPGRVLSTDRGVRVERLPSGELNDDDDDDDNCGDGGDIDSLSSAALSSDSESDDFVSRHPIVQAQLKEAPKVPEDEVDDELDDELDTSDALDDSGVDSDANVSVWQLPAFSFRSALDLLLAPYWMWPK